MPTRSADDVFHHGKKLRFNGQWADFVQIDRKLVWVLNQLLSGAEVKVAYTLFCLRQYTPGHSAPRIPGEPARRCLRSGEIVRSRAKLALLSGVSENTVKETLKKLQGFF